MTTLFPVESKYPEGFEYMPAFISNEEENSLLQLIGGIELQAFMFQGFEAKRRVASFGYDYSFEKGKLSKGRDIPVEFVPLIERVASTLKLETSSFAELLVTEYPVGAVINWHRDAPPFDIIAGISLNADCIFKLRPYESGKVEKGKPVEAEIKKTKRKSNVISIPVERRSLYIIKGEARTAWQHSTAPVKQPRYSITLRTLI